MKPTNHNQVEPVSMPTSSTISTMEDAGPQSVFVVVYYEFDSKCFSSMLQLDTKVNTYKYVAHFERPQGYPASLRWKFPHVPCSPTDLCMVCDWGPRVYQNCAPLLISIFNLTTKKCKSIKFPGGPIYYKHVVDMEEHIYFMGDSHPGYGSETSFSRYNRLQDSWETLEPLPYHKVMHWGDGIKGIIAATAVWNNNAILLIMVSCGMWAYDVATNKWYPVVDRGHWCDSIVGKAVVLENTIYALTEKEGLIVALSIRREQTEGGIEFRVTLLRDILVPGMDVVKYDEGGRWFKTRDLVHLGGDNLCIIRSGNSYVYPVDSQTIHVTYLKLEGKTSMTVTDTCVYNVELLVNAQFTVELCFALPEYMATAFKEGNRCFPFDPFPEHYTVRPDRLCKDPLDFSSKPTLPPVPCRDMIDEQAEGPFEFTPLIPLGATERLEKIRPIKSDEIQVINKEKGFLESSEINMTGEQAESPFKVTPIIPPGATERLEKFRPAQGHCIHVFNIPPDATVKQLEKSLKTFGPIKKDGIKVAAKNNMPYATVEFKAAPSKQRAIKASTIDIQGYKAVIGEVRRSGLVDTNRPTVRS